MEKQEVLYDRINPTTKGVSHVAIKRDDSIDALLVVGILTDHSDPNNFSSRLNYMTLEEAFEKFNFRPIVYHSGSVDPTNEDLKYVKISERVGQRFISQVSSEDKPEETSRSYVVPTNVANKIFRYRPSTNPFFQ